MHRTRLVLIFTLLSAGLALLVWTSSAQPEGGSTDFMTSYPLPYANSQPRNIVVESPGHLWFTLPGIDAIGSLVVTSTVDYAFTNYPTLSANSDPYDLAYDEGVIWFTQNAGNKIGRFDIASKTMTEYAIPTANSGPTGIAVAPDNNVWFTERDSNKLGRRNAGSGVIDEFTYNVAGGLLEDIAIEHSDSIWFTAPGVDRAANFIPSQWPASGAFFSLLACPAFPEPCNDPQPSGVVVASLRPIITTSGLARIGRYDPSTFGNWLWYVLNAGTGPTGITASGLGSLVRVWFAQTGSGQVGFIDLNAAGTRRNYVEYSLPGGGSEPYGIAVDANNHAWITDSGNNRIVEWSPPYVHQVDAPVIRKP